MTPASCRRSSSDSVTITMRDDFTSKNRWYTRRLSHPRVLHNPHISSPQQLTLPIGSPMSLTRALTMLSANISAPSSALLRPSRAFAGPSLDRQFRSCCSPTPKTFCAKLRLKSMLIQQTSIFRWTKRPIVKHSSTELKREVNPCSAALLERLGSSGGDRRRRVPALFVEGREGAQTCPAE